MSWFFVDAVGDERVHLWRERAVVVPAGVRPAHVVADDQEQIRRHRVREGWEDGGEHGGEDEPGTQLSMIMRAPGQGSSCPRACKFGVKVTGHVYI